MPLTTKLTGRHIIVLIEFLHIPNNIHSTKTLLEKLTQSPNTVSGGTLNKYLKLFDEVHLIELNGKVVKASQYKLTALGVSLANSVLEALKTKGLNDLNFYDEKVSKIYLNFSTPKITENGYSSYTLFYSNELIYSTNLSESFIGPLKNTTQSSVMNSQNTPSISTYTSIISLTKTNNPSSNAAISFLLNKDETSNQPLPANNSELKQTKKREFTDTLAIEESAVKSAKKAANDSPSAHLDNMYSASHTEPSSIQKPEAAPCASRQTLK